MITENPPAESNPVESHDIALCLSGGGYRAAAFHLGVMKSLDALGYMDRVKFLSTASGGTITAMRYAVDRTAGASFKDFYDNMSKFLAKVNVVDEGFKILQSTPGSTGVNNLSLIRCAAETYRGKLLGKRSGSDGKESDWLIQDLLDGMSERKTFRDLIFNSSEFRSGNNFRFRLSTERTLVYGNRNTAIKKEVGNQVELADVIAASSCFPGVFEPMRFPDDFRFSDRSKVTQPFRTNDFSFNSISLMDGGILDNQGLYGMTVSYEKPPQPFELLIVSDTSSRDDLIYDFDLEPRSQSLTLKSLLLAIGGCLLMLTISSIWIFVRSIMNFTGALDTIAGLTVSLFVFLFSISLLGAGIYGISKLRAFNFMGYTFPIWRYIKSLTVGDLWTLAKGRATSTGAMVFNVFMKRIRALQFSNTMSAVDKDTNESLFNGITIFSIIYSLIPDKNGNSALSFSEELKPSKRMVEIAHDASKVGTKLWLSNKDFRTLVDCGRITLCAVLLDYYWTEKKFQTLPKPENDQSSFHNVYLEWRRLLEEFA